MGRDHPDYIPTAANHRSGLAGVNASLKISTLIFRMSHELARSDIRRDDPTLVAQRDSTGALRVCAYPLPKFGGFGIESAKCQ